jgi:hypothetical protein
MIIEAILARTGATVNRRALCNVHESDGAGLGRLYTRSESIQFSIALRLAVQNRADHHAKPTYVG